MNINPLNFLKSENDFQHTVAKTAANVVALAVRKIAANEPWVASSATPHVGKTIAVNMPVLGQRLQLTWMVDATQILVAQSFDKSTLATVQLTVAPSVYGGLATLPFDMQSVMRHVQISGDVGLAEWVNRLAQQLRPDVWEDLSKVIGDAPSVYAQQAVSGVFNHFKTALSALTQQAQYVMLDESPVLVRHSHLDAFADDAQQLRYATERLAQRIELLKNKPQVGA